MSVPAGDRPIGRKIGAVAGLELPLVAIALGWVALRLRVEASSRAVIRRMVALAIAGFVGEQTMIRAYGGTWRWPSVGSIRPCRRRPWRR